MADLYDMPEEKAPEVTFQSLTCSRAEDIRQWRNDVLPSLRTPYALTFEQQQQWYKDVVCDRSANSRYWAVCVDGNCLGMAGIEHIDWQQGRGEISLLIAPNRRGKGYGTQAVTELWRRGFGELRLEVLWGECYAMNQDAIQFWQQQMCRYYPLSIGPFSAFIPMARKHEGKWYGAYYFCFDGAIWRKATQGSTDSLSESVPRPVTAD